MSRRRPTFDVVFYIPSIASLLRADPSASAGGAQTQIMLLSKALAARGLRVAVVAFEGGRWGTLPREVDGVSVITRPPYPDKATLADKIREIPILFASLARFRTPVVVKRIHGYEVGLIALACRLAGRRFVYSSANLFDVDASSTVESRPVMALHRLGLRLADVVVAQTPEQVALCEQTYGRDSVLIGSIAEPAPEAASTPADGFLWVGRVVDYKRPLEYIRLAQKLPEFTFRMVVMDQGASEPLLEELHRLARATPNVEHVPPQSRTELGALMQRSYAIVSTSTVEGMPNVFLEAWARGVPALSLSYDPGGVIAREQVGFVASGSLEDLGRLARGLAESPDRHLAGRCREYVQDNHSVSAVAARWETVLRLPDRRRRW